MAIPTQDAEAVIVKRRFEAPREKVFQAWTDPELMTRWFARSPKHPPTKVIEADVRPGGNYRIDVQGDRLYRGFGTYREVTPPEKLVFTWNWEHHDFTDALVTVEFRSLEPSGYTEVILTHELLPEADREAHRKGWNGCFDSLERVLRGEEF